MFNFQVYVDAADNTQATLQADGINYGVNYEVRFMESGVCALVNQSRCDRFIDRFDYFLLDANGKALHRTGQAQFQG